jgi:hypothetical protein
VHLADHLLVGAGFAEWFAVEDVGARKNFHSFDARLASDGDEPREEKEAKTFHQVRRLAEMFDRHASAGRANSVTVKMAATGRPKVPSPLNFIAILPLGMIRQICD